MPRPVIRKAHDLYTYDEMLRLVEDLIETEQLIYIHEVRDLAPVSAAEFDRHFKSKAHARQLHALLAKQRSRAKVSLRKDWRNNRSAVLQMALYKLNSTDEERRLLATTYTENENTNKFDGKVEVVMYTGGDVPPIATDEQEVINREPDNGLMES